MKCLHLLAAIALTIPCMVSAQPDLIITEIDYDEPGSDTAEWIEIHSTLDVPQPLSGFELVLLDASINGNCTSYCRVDLAQLGWINANETIVVGNHPCASLPLCSPLDAIQNGVPDAIVIEYFGEIVFAVEYGASTSISACQVIAPAWRTTAIDVDTQPGSIVWCQHGWKFSSASTPCQNSSSQCSTTDAVMPPATSTWSAVKSVYRN